MKVTVSAPPGAVAWEDVRGRLDQNEPFANMFDTPLYRDAVWPQFSRAEFARRHAALRAKMREHNLDVVIVPGGPSHWSFGGGMTWLTGHWEWHALCAYVVVPLEAEPTLIYSMGGTHCEAVRRHVEPAVADVRQSRGGRYAEVMVERIKELGIAKPRIGLVEIDPRHKDYLPVNQYNDLRAGLPEAEIVFTRSFIHELVVIKSEPELDCVRRAGRLCQHAMEAMVAAAKPGATEADLRGAAGAAIMRGGGDVDFLIIGSTSMANPSLFFGNPRPSERKLAKGDIVIMELAAGYRGYTAQIGSPICIGEPTEMVKRFWLEITLPGYRRIIAEIKPGNPIDNVRIAAQFFRKMGVQSRPTQIHGIDIVTAPPHVFAERTEAREADKIFKPGMVTMAEPNPISADGLFGIFLGHTLIVMRDGHEVVDDFPLELAVA